MTVALRLVPGAPQRAVCDALGVSRSSLRRQLAGPTVAALAVEHPTRRSRRRIPDAERQVILERMHADPYVDLAVPQMHAQWLDEGIYLCSVSTLYRILRANAEVKERRAQARHPVYAKPELLATVRAKCFHGTSPKFAGPIRAYGFLSWS
jgi:putative transposase